MPRKIKKIAGKLKNMVKKMAKDFCNSNNRIIFAVAKAKGPVAQLNRASDYGSEGYRFESCRGHSKKEMCEHLFFVCIWPLTICHDFIGLAFTLNFQGPYFCDFFGQRHIHGKITENGAVKNGFQQ